MSPKTSKYCLVIPVINEGERLLKQLNAIKSSDFGIDIIIADGGSTDGSVAEQNLRDHSVRTLLTKVGPGTLSAQIRMAFDYALNEKYQGVITIDGNGKDGVDAIEGMIFSLDNGHDFIQASRFVPGGKAINTPLSRLLAIKIVHAPITSLAAKFRFTDTTNGFRGHSRILLMDSRVGVFRNIFDTYELLAYMPIRASKLGFRCIEIPATRAYPESGNIPTKIHGPGAQLALLKILLRAAFGMYNPK
jgi:glycosyltransferase involved in cell wall biosynthesis